MDTMIKNLLNNIEAKKAAFRNNPEDVPDVKGLKFAALTAEEHMENLRSEMAHANAGIAALDDQIDRFQYGKKKSREEFRKNQERENKTLARNKPHALDYRKVGVFNAGKILDSNGGVYWDSKKAWGT